jgi:phosphatidylglycerophosphatase A
MGLTRRIIVGLATWGGLGFLPKAPGTFGTLGAIPLLLLLERLPPTRFMLAVVIFIGLAIFISELYQAPLGSHDSQQIVIDEVAGFLVTMMWIPLSVVSLVFGFVLFRALDIFKPYPISVIDRRIKGGLGVVTDDLAAGLVANIVLQFLFNESHWLMSFVGGH